MTPVEEAAVQAAIEEAVSVAMDNGIRAAAVMVRMTAKLHPEMTFDQLADALESTVGGRSDD